MNVSELARDLLDRALAKRERAKIKHTYQVLKELDGIGGEDVTDASTTIDEVLYGEEGEWKVSNADDTGANR
ncbi:MAG: hypothetical protein COU69_01420 [Candidatus Pacebacteria bacterium CG10_big_fil_rev_8_21_14_0_10_56_10]|nr:MAG: hypothetical protein COU69_01420 [Candidatus Pacebacteria bacterium CG10_big_fil_rev_8_21_14_0_10_56_10]